MNNNSFTIISFYQFRQLKNLLLLKKFFGEFCYFHKLRGTILLAPEGINGVLAGFDRSIKLFEKLRNLPLYLIDAVFINTLIFIN